MNDASEQRFGGIARLYGVDGLALFRRSHVAVIGIGGVGSWAAEALARSGVGEITLIDLDDLCVTNINRQIHALSSTIGQSKVAVMAERIREINPDCLVHEVEAFASRDNLDQLLHPGLDYVIDAIDSVPEKAALIAWCKRHKVAVITIGGAGGQIDPTLIRVADLTRVCADPLAAKVRATLRRHYHFSRSGRRFAVECVYSQEQLRYPQPDGSVGQRKSVLANGTRLDCAGGFGATSVVTASFGFVAVARVLAKLQQRAAREQTA
jgi:tRNA A37 threonylcarbamoyladenosine dehydratase